MGDTETRTPRSAAFRTIRARMLCWVLAVTIPIYAAALYMSYQATAQRLEANAARDADELASQLASSLDTVVRPVEGGIRTVAHQLEEVNPPPEQYAARIHGILAAWPEVYGSTIAVEVHEGDPNSRAFAPYYFRRGAAIAYSDLALAEYGYAKLRWYRDAADLLQPVWSEPYFDKGGGEAWMVTYSVPFFRKASADQRELAGVVTADLALKWVEDNARNLRLGSFDVGWLVSPPSDETFIAPIGTTGSRLAGKQAPIAVDVIRGEAEKMLAGGRNFGLLPSRATAEKIYIAVHPLATLDWRVILLIPRAALLADARSLLARQLWLGAAGLFLLIAAISFIAAGISRPIHALADSVRSAEEGNLDFRLPEVTTRDETGVLTEALRRLRDSLKTHVQLHAESLAAQSRLEHELQIAANIQQAMLPKGDAAGLPRAVRIAAVLVPAKQVGGDFFDYFALRDGNLLFAIGDVSDKGIPAALFMARVTGLLRVLGNVGTSPERLMSDINARLVEGNDACMFVTVGCGVLDTGSGMVKYVSAGHEPPLVLRVDGSVAPLRVESGAAVGIDAPAEYRLAQGFIAPGDTLMLYTDGVTEAETGDHTLFGADRLIKLLSEGDAGDPSALVRRVVDSVGAGSADFHAGDDVTVLAVCFSPPTVEAQRTESGELWRIAATSSQGGVRQVQRWLQNILVAREIAAERIGDVELIAEELLTNIVRENTAAGGEVAVTVECALSRDEITLTFRDDGKPFDPLARAEPDLSQDVANRSVGGLGIHIVRELADAASYTRLDEQNVLEIRLGRIPESKGAST
jgi:sigma-B regulation protein RsbU (phosphoserine phosphatase)